MDYVYVIVLTKTKHPMVQNYQFSLFQKYNNQIHTYLYKLNIHIHEVHLTTQYIYLYELNIHIHKVNTYIALPMYLNFGRLS